MPKTGQNEYRGATRRKLRLFQNSYLTTETPNR